MPLVRVLVVEDFVPFQRFIASTLGKKPELWIVCEVSDGLEAVQKAQELQPDLILLDIGLPSLNGIEAARRIRKVSPESKILFLSQESAADAVQEALGLGGLGYVVKIRAGSELLPAVEAVLRGEQFVSSGLTGHWFPAQAPLLRQRESLPSPAPEKGETTRNHRAHFYADDESLLLGFTRFVESALKAGNTAIVIATQSNLKGLLQRLQAHGVDCAAAIEQGLYIPLDVEETLSTIIVNDQPDPVRFSKVVGDLIAAAVMAAKGERPRVAVCGEGAPTLWAQGHADAAIRLEHLWDEIARTHDVDILCGYVSTRIQREQGQDVHKKIWAEHSSVDSD
jgi:DNA-binding NarL/FixJ family response regulator